MWWIPNQPMINALAAAPAMAIVALGVLLVIGLILWLLGRKLARPACGASGLVLGALAGMAVGQYFSAQGAMVLPLSIGGAIGGALLAALLFRVWMGLSGAMLLALLAPAASVVWMGVLPAGELTVAVPAADSVPQEASATQPATLEAVGKIARELIYLIPTGSPGSPGSRQDDAAAAAAGPLDIVPTAAAAVDLLARFEELGRRQGEQVSAWYEQLSGTARTGVYGAAAVGAIVGLIFGLLAPYIAASFQSALVGSMLMLFAGYGLMAQLAPALAEHLPRTPRSILLALGLITVVGCLIQWCAFGKRADK